MKAAKTWCVASLLVVAAFSLPSCGKDEANGNNEGGSGMVLPTGGSAGTGNVAGGRTGGASGMGGSGGSSSNVGATKLGRGCIADADCVDTKAPGLTCVTATDTVLGNGAPPSGLCTAECASDQDCSELGAGALCYPFTAGADTGYCIEGCSFGMAELGEIKCHNRAEFACNPALLSDTGEPCTDTATDCQAGELCLDGTCAVVFPGCLPSCRGDLDCEDGMYCDQSFLSGVCVTEKPQGKGLGEPCTVPAEGEPSEPDGCLGFCQADAETGNAGHCATTCGLLNECAWNAETKKFDGACFYASILTFETGYIGDFGFCTPTCNCTEECNDEDLVCSLLEQGALPAEFRGPGLCFSPAEPPDPPTVEYNQCGMGGGDAGGAGGMGSAGAPSGEGGAGGAP
jgi:hypothetical protein